MNMKKKEETTTYYSSGVQTRLTTISKSQDVNLTRIDYIFFVCVFCIINIWSPGTVWQNWIQPNDAEFRKDGGFKGWKWQKDHGERRKQVHVGRRQSRSTGNADFVGNMLMCVYSCWADPHGPPLLLVMHPLTPGHWRLVFRRLFLQLWKLPHGRQRGRWGGVIHFLQNT